MYLSIGTVLGIVITSQPYNWVLYRLNLEDDSFLTCGLCLGMWVGMVTEVTRLAQAIPDAPNVLALAVIPLAAEKTVRWILKI